jgi:organic radical activating enzyme
MSRSYKVNECYLSVQGEGVRAGTVNVFVRFSACNLKCDIEPGPKSPGGFACDTEFASGRMLTTAELVAWIEEESRGCRWIIATGGEPGLQLDRELVDALHLAGFKIAVETNGSVEIDKGVNWITVSPKVAEHAIKQRTANEVKYVRGYGQAIPETVVTADHYLISPAFSGLVLEPRILEWCLGLVLNNPTWRLSLQLHKFIQVR